MCICSLLHYYHEASSAVVFRRRKMHSEFIVQHIYVYTVETHRLYRIGYEWTGGCSWVQFLADRNNNLAYAIVLRPSVRLSVCDVCIVAKRCVITVKVTDSL